MSRVEINPTIHRLWGRAACTVSPLKTGSEWQRDFVLEFTRLIVEETMREVDERTFCRGETSWYDSDKDWIRLHFGYGGLKK
jgi:hypothetical protein